MGYTHGTPKDAEFRTCTCCGETFPNTDEYFSKNNRDGHSSLCKKCESQKNKEKNNQLKKMFSTVKIEYEGERVCRKCGRSLPNSYRFFPVDKTCKDGLRHICRECNPKFKNFLPEDYEPNIPWTKEEDEIMRRYYNDYTGEELRDNFLQGRTIRAIECRASYLGIQGNKTYDEVRRMLDIRNKRIGNGNRGRHMSDEQKQHLSEVRKEYYKTHTSWWLGKKRSKEQCMQISERMKEKWAGDKNPRHIYPLNGEENGRWKGGINQTYAELRSETKDWQKESMEFCGYHCVISGGDFDNIHHTVPFRDIVDEVFENTGIAVKDKVMNYSPDEFSTLRMETHLLHNIYGLGACVQKDIHKLFHDEYGYTKFTPYDFLDFIYRIDCGEFDKWFKENQLSININYEYVEYLEGILQEMKSV